MFPLIIYFSHLTKKSAIQNSGKQSFKIISSFVKKKKKNSQMIYTLLLPECYMIMRKIMLLKIFLLLNEIIVFSESGLVG